MIRSYAKQLILTAWTIEELSVLEALSLKTSEGLVAIQEHGGTILQSSLMPAASLGVYSFYVVYEDNGNYEEINSYLRDVVFNFVRLKKE